MPINDGTVIPFQSPVTHMRLQQLANNNDPTIQSVISSNRYEVPFHSDILPNREH